MTGDITSADTLLKVQGDRVLVHWRYADGSESGDAVCTFIHVVDVDRRELRLVNRETKKLREPDWRVSQKLFDSIKPAPTNQFNAKWSLHVKL